MGEREVTLSITHRQMAMLIDLVSKRGSHLVELKKEAKINLNDRELKEYIEEELDNCVSLYSNLVSKRESN